MSIQKIKKLTTSEYLEIERRADYKSEFYNGEMFALAGASLLHNKIVVNLTLALGNQLKDKRCDVFQSDLKIKELNSEFFLYPDIVVICGKPEFYDNKLDVITNPALVIEVLSKSTEAYDRGFKFELYRRFISLKNYVLVSQKKVSVECYTRNSDNSWNLKEYADKNQVIELKSITCNLELKEIYNKIDPSDLNDQQ